MISALVTNEIWHFQFHWFQTLGVLPTLREGCVLCFLLGRNLVLLFINIEVRFSVIFGFLGVVLSTRSLAVLLFSLVSVCLGSLFLFPFLKGGLGFGGVGQSGSAQFGTGQASA